MVHSQAIVELAHIDTQDKENFGLKAIEFGELIKLGIPIPDGFVISTAFYKEFLELTEIDKDIEKAKANYHPSLQESSHLYYEHVRKKILHTHLPQKLASFLHEYYRNLTGDIDHSHVNVLSSTKTDKSVYYENVLGDANVLLKIKEIWADHFDNPAAILVLKSLESDTKGKIATNNASENPELTEQQNNLLSEYCKQIQSKFYFPKEVSYLLSDNIIYVTNIVPVTQAVEQPIELKNEIPEKPKTILVKGAIVNPGMATGTVKILQKPLPNIIVKKDNILILPNLDKQFYLYIEKAKAVISDSIFATPAKKAYYKDLIKIPTIEGAKNALSLFQNGNVITVNGNAGEIYQGGLT